MAFPYRSLRNGQRFSKGYAHRSRHTDNGLCGIGVKRYGRRSAKQDRGNAEALPGSLARVNIDGDNLFGRAPFAGSITGIIVHEVEHNILEVVKAVIRYPLVHGLRLCIGITIGIITHGDFVALAVNKLRLVVDLRRSHRSTGHANNDRRILLCIQIEVRHMNTIVANSRLDFIVIIAA